LEKFIPCEDCHRYESGMDGAGCTGCDYDQAIKEVSRLAGKLHDVREWRSRIEFFGDSIDIAWLDRILIRGVHSDSTGNSGSEGGESDV
jgi:hypothetical protein